MGASRSTGNPTFFSAVENIPYGPNTRVKPQAALYIKYTGHKEVNGWSEQLISILAKLATLQAPTRFGGGPAV